MGPNALFSFDQFIYMTIFYPLITFRRHPCSSSTGINNRAAGLRAVVMVFAEPLRQFYRDGTIPAHLSGLSRQDSSIWTRKLASIYRDFAKTHANPDTDGNCPYHRAVVCNNIFTSICPLAPGKVCGSTVTNSWFIGIKIFNKEGLWNLCRKPAYTSQANFIMTPKLVLSG